MTRNDRFQTYLDAQRKTRSFQRAADYVVLAIVLILLAGSAIGLIPELEKLRHLDEEVANAKKLVHNSEVKLKRERLRLQHLTTEVEYMEQEYRNRSRRAAKPGETLILLPGDLIEVYEGEKPRH